MSVLDEKLEAIETVCSTFRVVRLDAYGAVTGDDYDASSDPVIFAAAFEPSTPQAQYERFFGLQQALEIVMESEIELIDYKALLEGSFLRQLPKEKVTLYRQEKA